MSAGIRDLNVFDICRLCLDKEKTLVYVFETDELHSKIASCLQVQISKTDEVTQQICNDCASKVDIFYDFWNKTVESQKELEVRLAEMKKEEGQKQISELRMMKNRPVNEDSESEDLEDEEDGGTEEEEECYDEEGDYEDGYKTEEYLNGNELDGDERRKMKGSDIKIEMGHVKTLEPTTFVNVPMESEEPGPSGINSSETDPTALPETSTETATLETRPESPLDLCQTLNGESPQVCFACEKCGDKFETENSLDEHIETHKEKTKTYRGTKRVKKHVCSLCPYSSLSATNFKIHTMKHNNESLVTCKVCGKEFYSMFRYREHFKEKHSGETKIHRCQVCGKDYHSKNYLEHHMKTHDPGYSRSDFQCEVCGRTFHSLKGVRRHIQTVHEGSRHKCGICGKEVTCAQSLKNHMKIHSGEKRYVCEACGKGFISLSGFNVHERTHTGVKPFSCDLCDKSFTQKATLQVHRRYHTGERPFQCRYCDRCFVTKSATKTHEEKAHSGLEIVDIDILE